MSSTLRSLFFVLGALCSAVSASPPADGAAEWRSYGNDPGGMRYSPLKQIDRTNVTQLRRAWTFHTGERDQASTGRHRIEPFESTPLMIDGVLYLSTPWNRVVALDAETGEKRWEFDPERPGNGPRRLKGQHRGVAFWRGRVSGAMQSRILFGTYDGRLIALDAATGLPAEDFGSRGTVDLRAGFVDRWPRLEYGVTSPPAVYKDVVIVGAAVPEVPGRGPSGAVRAFDARTGKAIWQFNTVPQPGEAGHATWEGESWRDRTGVNVWSIMSVDPDRGLVFLPVGSAAYDFYGGDRKGANLYANSLVALDAATGKLRWHYQLVHHDIWDYDLPAQPALITLTRNRRPIPAVVQVTKMGLVFVFDRVTGQPLFPIEEVPVPQSDVPGEATWPTQPVPTRPAPLSRFAFKREDLTTVTPESRAYCAKLADSLATKGRYTPWGLTPTLLMPGTLGGATWSGASFDPASGYLFVNVNEVGAVGYLEPRSGPVPYRRTSEQGEYARFWDADHLPCQQPPWGTLNAVDLNTGEVAWKVPLGVVDALLEKGITDTGALNLGGSIVTAGGLVFIAGTNDSRFRAFDSKTGKELWAERLEASGHATPMTYRGPRSGRQFVVVAAGGGGTFSHNFADVVAAYALPAAQ